MSFWDALFGSRGRHGSCSGCHWHLVTSGWQGWRCCGCLQTSPRRDRPTDIGKCRLNLSTPAPPSLAGQPLHRNDAPTMAWLAELTGPGDNTAELPGTGPRRLRRRAVNQLKRGGR